jgi:hypothetical protein
MKEVVRYAVGLDSTIDALRAHDRELGLKLARAVLMFYEAVEWTDERRAEWRALTGADDATTRTLGDLARKVLEAAS